MNKNDNYFEFRDEQNILKLREVFDYIPDFAKEFFLGIQLRTSVLTRLNYAYDLRIFFDYLSKKKFITKQIREITIDDLNTISAFDIEVYIDYLTSYYYNKRHYCCGENAKERKLSSLRSFFGYYFKKDKLNQNVTVKVDLPKLHEKSIIRLEKNEIQELLSETEMAYSLSKTQQKFHIKTQLRDSAIITLLLGTGLRISECIGLNKQDINFKNNSLSVTRKGGNKNILFFSEEVADALKKYLDWLFLEIENKTIFGNKIYHQKSPLFFSLQGNRITVRAVEILVKKYCSVVTPLKKITPHKLRSTYGTQLYRETQDIYVVAEVLGHKDINTTKKHYAAMSEDIRKKAANAVKLRDNDFSSENINSNININENSNIIIKDK